MAVISGYSCWFTRRCRLWTLKFWRSFEGKLEQIIRDSAARPAAELPDLLLSEISHWQPSGAAQQDDITLIVMDAV
jgi:hypothetical protein